MASASDLSGVRGPPTWFLQSRKTPQRAPVTSRFSYHTCQARFSPRKTPEPSSFISGAGNVRTSLYSNKYFVRPLFAFCLPIIRCADGRRRAISREWNSRFAGQSRPDFRAGEPAAEIKKDSPEPPKAVLYEPSRLEGQLRWKIPPRHCSSIATL